MRTFSLLRWPLLLLLFVLSIPVARAIDTLYVSKPVMCPTEYTSQFPGQNCSSGTKICGYDTSTLILECFDNATISAPGSTADSDTLYSASFTGGYVINCLAAKDSAAPYCDNNGAWNCNRDASCFTTQERVTTCAANKRAGDTNAFSCGACHSGRQDCTGDVACEVITGSTNFPTGANNNYAAACGVQCDSGFVDCDAGGAGATNGCEIQSGVTNFPTGANNNYNASCNAQCDSGYNDCDASGAGAGNGCEIQTGSACTTGGNPGIYNGCTCVPSARPHFIHSSGATFASELPALWGTQNGTGSLVDMASRLGTRFSVTNSGSVIFRGASLSGAVVHAEKTLSSSGGVIWEGSASGAFLWLSTFEGAGLTDCDTAATSKLLWDATGKRFSCGTDQTGGSGVFGTGNVITIGDSRYVNTSGDTMTGNLVVLSKSVFASVFSGTTFKILGTASGNILHAEKTLSSSGTLIFEGAGSGNSLTISGIVNFGKFKGCNLDTDADGNLVCGTDADTSQNLFQTIAVSGQSDVVADSTTDTLTLAAGSNVTITTTAGTDTVTIAATDTNTTYTAGQGLTLDGTSFKVNGILTGSLLEFTTVSGSTVYGYKVQARDSLTSSGSFVWEGQGSGAALYIGGTLEGVGLTDCDLTTSKLLWDATSKRFGCGTDGGTVLVDHYVNVGGDTMTGALAINVNGGGINTLGLRVINTLSGAIVHGNKQLRSSGAIITESGAIIDGDTLFVDANGNNVGIHTTTFDGSTNGLQVQTTDRGDINVLVTDTDASRAVGLGTDASGNGQIAFWSALGSLRGLLTADEDSYFITSVSTAKLGIGTDTPTAKLHVLQGSTADALRVDDVGSDSTPFVIGRDGNVGIGTATPTGKLQVIGSGSFSTNLFVYGALSGSSLTISRASSFSGNVLIKGNVNTRGTLSGTTVYTGRGTVSAPAFTWVADTDTGYYSPGGQIGTAVDGVLKMAVSGTGLHLFSTSGATTLRTGSGSPENKVAANLGSLFLDRRGRGYVKSDSGATVKGWSPILMPSFIRKSGDDAVNADGTLNDDDELFVQVGKQETIAFQITVIWDSGSTPDIQFAITAPTGSTCVYGAVTDTGVNGNDGTETCGTGIRNEAVGVGSLDMSIISGTVTTGSTAGFVKLQWAQGTSNASNTTVHAGSYAMFYRNMQP